MIIVIDGTSGAGKGTVATYLAERFSLRHLDTGLLYRTVAYALIQKSLPIDSLEHVMSQAHEAIPVFMENVSAPCVHLRQEDVANVASKIALFEPLREYLNSWMRRFADQLVSPYKGNILDGRDMGTVVIPYADFKFYITASIDARIQRRLTQLEQVGLKMSNVHELQARDQRDQGRSEASRKMAPDAYLVDSTHLTVDEVKHICADYILEKMGEKLKMNGSF